MYNTNLFLYKIIEIIVVLESKEIFIFSTEEYECEFEEKLQSYILKRNEQDVFKLIPIHSFNSAPIPHL